MLVTRFGFITALLSAVGLVKLQAQQPVVITPGQTTFGPPKPVNGECPTCHTINAKLVKDSGMVAASAMGWPPVLVRCKFCSSAFYQDYE